MMKGMIFNIQRFSIHDGPGIRTTIFFKGCPLSCRWCANPESKNVEPELLYTAASCIHCGACLKACPNNAITISKGHLIRELSSCTNCLSCVSVCPTRSLTVEGDWYSVDEVMHEIQKDDAFYKKSNGGITLSGGEPLLQEAFTLELLQTLKSFGYHANIETSGYTSPAYMKAVLPYLDMVYMDLKHPDSSIHFSKTGVPNESILNNMQAVLHSGTPLTVRIPVIPRFNHSLETTWQYVRVLKNIGASEIHLLPFHQMGLGKWRALGLPYDYEKDKSMKDGDVKEMADILSSCGFHVQING